MLKKPQTDPIGCHADILAMSDTLEVIGGKWTLLIVHYLITRQQEKNTFRKIQHDIDTISAKVLSKELKKLVVNNIISRKVIDKQVLSVEYAITDYGMLLKQVITTLVQWGQTHRTAMFSKHA
jgi:DNA-binding HxlR family transcriptional regulator